MKHHGIKVNPRLVPALLDGTKTMHVERMKDQPEFVPLDLWVFRNDYTKVNHTPTVEPYAQKQREEIVREFSPIQPGDVVFLDEDFQWVAGDQTTPATRWSAIVKSVEAKRRADLTQEEIKKCGDSEGVACKLSEWIWVYEWRKT